MANREPYDCCTAAKWLISQQDSSDVLMQGKDSGSYPGRVGRAKFNQVLRVPGVQIPMALVRALVSVTFPSGGKEVGYTGDGKNWTGFMAEYMSVVS